MLRVVSLTVLLFCSFSCKKAIEKKQEQVIMDAITSGFWVVDLYSENGQVLTGEYSGYDFKFNDDETLNALKAGTSVAGTWKPNITLYTITTNFPGAAYPLTELSSVWKLTDSDWDYVKSESTVNGVRKVLHLRKK